MASRVLARLDGNKVTQVIEEHEDIAQEWHPDFLAGCVDVTNSRPRPQVGWIKAASGRFAPPPPFIPDPEEQASAAILAGCELRFSTKPELDGVYLTSGQLWQDMRDSMTYVASFGEFPSDQESLECSIKEGVVIFQTIDDFRAVVRALSNWVANWRRFAAGTISAPPAQPVVIA